jgi:hypothetical protein
LFRTRQQQLQHANHPSIMNSIQLILVSIAAFLCIDQCKAAKPRQQVLTLNAEVTSADGDPQGAYALLFIDGVLVDSTNAGRFGGFSLDLPVDKEALLEVHKPGSISKRVVIDTRNIARSQNLTCAIMLFPQPLGERMDYTGPVGRVSFDASGAVKVEHDYQLTSQRIDTPNEELIAADR